MNSYTDISLDLEALFQDSMEEKIKEVSNAEAKPSSPNKEQTCTGSKTRKACVPEPAVAGTSKEWPRLAEKSAPSTETTRPNWRPQLIPQSPQTHKDAWEKHFKQYVEGNVLQPIPEVWKKLEPRVLSLVATDRNTKRLTGAKREDVVELLLANGIPAKYICRRSFGTWDILLPTEEEAKKLAKEIVYHKQLRMQPEYRGRRKTNITIYNVPVDLSTEYLAAFLSKYGDVEAMSPSYERGSIQTGDYLFLLNLNLEGFKAIPDRIEFRGLQITIQVEGRKPHCWVCRKQGHIAKDCPARAPANPKTAPPAKSKSYAAATTKAAQIGPSKEAVNTKAAAAAAKTTKTGEGWTEVVRKGNKPLHISTTFNSPVKSKKASPPQKKITPMEAEEPASTGAKRRLEDEGGKRLIAVSSKRKKEAPSKSPNMKTVEKTTTTDTTKSQNTPVPTTSSQPTIPHTPKTLPGSTITPLRPHSIERSVAKNLKTPSPPRCRSVSPQRQSHTPSRSRKKHLFPENLCRVDHAQVNKTLTHQQKKMLGPLLKFDSVKGVDVENPLNFRDAPSVTTFVRSAEGRATGVWRMVEAAEVAFPGVRLAEREHPQLKKLAQACHGRAPVFMHPSFYRAIKLRFPTDVGGIARTGQVTSELGTGSLGQTVGILTPADFRPVVDTK